jgi:hypothetical protein
MPETCTCGTELAPGSVFCHKCGKPQQEIAATEPEIRQEPEFAPVASPPPPAPQALPLNFHNPIAVRISLLVAVGATVLNLFLPFLTWIAAGFFAVYFYHRRTGSFLNVGAGVRLGWITGLLTFALSAIAFTAQLVPDALNGKLGPILQEQMSKGFHGQDPAIQQQIMSFFQTGSGIFFLLLLSFTLFFFFITGLSIAGGALGAKFVGRQSN